MKQRDWKKPIGIRIPTERDYKAIETAAAEDALPVMDWIRATAIREARKRVAQLKANTGKA